MNLAGGVSSISMFGGCARAGDTIASRQTAARARHRPNRRACDVNTFGSAVSRNPGRRVPDAAGARAARRPARRRGPRPRGSARARRARVAPEGPPPGRAGRLRHPLRTRGTGLPRRRPVRPRGRSRSHFRSLPAPGPPAAGAEREWPMETPREGGTATPPSTIDRAPVLGAIPIGTVCQQPAWLERWNMRHR